MRQLVGRITALDPEASETLKVIAYFDTLIDGRVGTDALLKGAAILVDVVVGYESSRAKRSVRFSPNGSRLTGEGPEVVIRHSVDQEAVIWLKRDAPLANDAMVLERLSIALTIASARTETEGATRRAVETLLDGSAEEEQRWAALDRLRIDRHAACRAVAVPSGIKLEASAPQAMVSTSWGIVQALIVPEHSDVDAGRRGVGIATSVGEVDRSWRTALVALRWTDPETPVRNADDLGPLLLLADAFDSRTDTAPEVAAIDQLLTHQWTLPTLQAVADGSSVRTIAAAAGLHHSTMQVRLRQLGDQLGFDPGAPFGRTRLQLGLFLHALAHNRFD